MAEQTVQCWCGCDESRPGVVGERSVHQQDRHRRCYVLAYRYAASRADDADVQLVHGKIIGQDQGKLIRSAHAWIVEADGWVWEPTNNTWFHSEPR